MSTCYAPPDRKRPKNQHGPPGSGANGVAAADSSLTAAQLAARPASDGTFWRDLIRRRHPTVEDAARNRFVREGEYLFFDEDAEGVTERERDAMLLPAWKGEYLRREEALRALVGDEDGASAPREDSDPGFDRYEFVVNFWGQRGHDELLPSRKTVNSTSAPKQRKVVSLKLGGSLAKPPACGGYGPCGADTKFPSSLVLDLTPFVDSLGRIYPLADFQGAERPDLEVFVLEKEEAGGGKKTGRWAQMYEGGMSHSVSGRHCKAQPYNTFYRYKSLMGASWFGDEYFEDEFSDYVESGCSRRPLLPRTKPYLHARDGRLELHLGVMWGGKSICEKKFAMGERDIRAFLRRCLTWNDRSVAPWEEGGCYVGLKEVPFGGCCLQTTASRMMLWKKGSRYGDSLGWNQFEYDGLEETPSLYTFLVDFAAKVGDAVETPSTKSVASVAIKQGSVKKNKLSLVIPDGDRHGAAISSLLRDARERTSLRGMVTVIERKTGCRATLFRGEAIRGGGGDSARSLKTVSGYSGFGHFSALRSFSREEEYSRAVWPEATLRVSDDGGTVEVELHWAAAREGGRQPMEEHLTLLFFRHGLTFD